MFFVLVSLNLFLHRLFSHIPSITFFSSFTSRWKSFPLLSYVLFVDLFSWMTPVSSYTHGMSLDAETIIFVCRPAPFLIVSLVLCTFSACFVPITLWYDGSPWRKIRCSCNRFLEEWITDVLFHNSEGHIFIETPAWVPKLYIWLWLDKVCS
jgi:hypothetical protein